MKRSSDNRLAILAALICAFIMLVALIKDASAHDPVDERFQAIEARIDALPQMSQTTVARFQAIEARIDALPQVSEITTTAAEVIAELQADVERLSNDIAHMTYLQEQISANRKSIDGIAASGAGVYRTTAIPPRRFHEFANGSLIPNDVVISQTNFIDVTFTIDNFAADKSMVLVSRDETGQKQSGHFALYIGKDRRLRVRNQGVGDQPEIQLQSQQQLESGTPHRAHLIIGPRRMVLFLDGIEVDSSEAFYPLSGNDLPLIVGGSCWAITREVCEADPSKRGAKLFGTVSVDLYQNKVTFLVH